MSDPTPRDSAMNRLRSHIRSLDDDEPARHHLDGLADDIEARLVRSGDAPGPDQLNERLNDTILRFEARHPRIAELLNDLAEQLAKMGV
jgi:Domain of unknown function (DUF4404)